MNVEEGDIAGAISRNAGLLGYAHVADSNRGMLGGGHFDLVGYSGRWRSGLSGRLHGRELFLEMLSPALVGGGVRAVARGLERTVAAARTAFEVMTAARAMAVEGHRVW